MTGIDKTEHPEVEKKYLEQLRHLLKEEAGLRDAPSDDALLMFLRGRKYNVRKSLKTIRNYFRVRRDMPEYFDNLTPSSIPYQKVFYDNKLIMHATERDPEGRAVGILKLGSWSTDICTMDNLVRCLLLAAECSLLEADAQVRGVVGVIDLQGLGAHHLMHLTPWFVRRIITIAQASTIS
ncbi:alpha-tocopherol transfer protein-like [Amblyomma americanum]